ncbi:MAG: hypothetical protein AABZ14_03260 [Candidatus Margulisiibacteriota bacterium]
MKTVSYYRKPIELSVEEWQIELRKQYSATQQFEVTNREDSPVFSDFNVFNPLTNKTYKVAIRSMTPGFNYCSCPDFATNNLGTCKHIEFLLARFQKTRKCSRREAKTRCSQRDQLQGHIHFGIRETQDGGYKITGTLDADGTQL